MASRSRVAVLAILAVVVIVGLAVAALPMFLNTESFRTKIESSVSKSLGRKVTIGTLKLSVFSGGLLAGNVTVADDASFSTAPFVEAQSVKVHVALWPLLTQRKVQVGGFVLQSPRVTLLRGTQGMWNYSSIGRAAGQTAQDEETQSTFPNLTVGEVRIENGQVTVSAQPAAAGSGAATSRIYDQVDLLVTDFSFAKAFPFTASAHLPGEGTVSVKGTAGPVNQADASATPFSGNLVIKHLDPLAAGFVDPSDGISGLVESLTLDASWSGQQMHVTKLVVDGPHLSVVRNNAPKTPKPAGNPEGSTMLKSLAVDSAEINNGALTLTTAGQTGPPAVYQNLHATLTNLTPTTASPFTLGAQLPGGGTLNANGSAGPFDAAKEIATPVNAQVSLRHFELQTGGVVPPDAGISGMADLDAKIVSNGQTLNANGTARVEGIRLAKNGTASGKPVQLQFNLAQNEQALTGTIEQAVVTVGRAVVNVAGTYQSSGPTTAIDLKVNGQGMPIDEIEAFLPALGVKLPTGSRLQGGTLTANLTVSGSTANPVVSGPVRLDNTVLAGFDLSSKLQAITRLTGARSGSATQLRSLSMDVRDEGSTVRTDKIALDMPALGTATGSGSVADGGALNYHVILKPAALGGVTSAIPAGGAGGGIAGQLLGMVPGGAVGKGIGGLGGGALKGGIPVAIAGTTSNPTFTPDLRGLAGSIGAGAAQGLIRGKTGQGSPDGKVVGSSVTNSLSGLFGKHK